MLEHFKGDEIFVKKILDYKDQALYHQRMILTPFFNPHEQDIVHRVIGKELQVLSFGGFENAENQRMIICPDYYEINNEDFQIDVVEVLCNHSFASIKHSDVLGALMSLGIKRECIGDISDHEHIYFACTHQTSSYIMMNLKQIRHCKVNYQIVDEKITLIQQYTSKTFFISSFRLDKVVASLFRLSRNEASEAIRSGNVKVNHKVIEEVNFLCHNDSIISLRHHGRVKLVDEQRQTKQGNFVVVGYFYK